MNGETKRDAAVPEQAQTPPDCFRLEELERFQSLESQTLDNINYYLWLHSAPSGRELNQGILYFLELIFEHHDPLYLTCGEDSTAIQVSDEATLLDTAARLQSLHGQPTIQRIRANTSLLWQPLIGKTLTAIHLARHENGLYANNALKLDFGDSQIVVQLAQKEGLEIVKANDEL